MGLSKQLKLQFHNILDLVPQNLISGPSPSFGDRMMAIHHDLLLAPKRWLDIRRWFNCEDIPYKCVTHVSYSSYMLRSPGLYSYHSQKPFKVLSRTFTTMVTLPKVLIIGGGMGYVIALFLRKHLIFIFGHFIEASPLRNTLGGKA
jgi:hypothetical protein